MKQTRFPSRRLAVGAPALAAALLLSASANYSITAETQDGGGRSSTSAIYTNTGSVETATMGDSSSTDFGVRHGYVAQIQVSALSPPTAARLAYFRAEAAGTGDVVLTWGTWVELMTLGFYVERRTPDGGWQQVGAGMLPALGADRDNPGKPNR